MKNCFSWVGRSIVFGSLMVGTVGVGASIALDKNPTEAEIQKLRADVKRDIQKNGPPRSRERNPQDQVLINSWKGTSPEAIPFMGGWDGMGVHISIYPSSKRGNVCVVYREIASFFVKGKVDGDLLKLENGNVYLVEQGTLIPFRRKYVRDRVYYPSSLFIPVEGLDNGYENPRSGQSNEEIKNMAKEAGCQSTSPILGKASENKGESTIENLPDGNHHYKYKAGRSETMAFSFQKKGRMISAWDGSLTELDYCTLGQVEGNSIVKGVRYVQIYGDRSNNPTFELIKTPMDLSHMTPMTLQDAENFGDSPGGRISAGYIKSRLRRNNPLSHCEDLQSSLMSRFVAAYGDPRSTESSQIETTLPPQAIIPQTPIAAQPTANSRPPNAQEIATIDRTIRDSKVPNLSRNQSIDRQTLQSKSSKFLKPFAGGWISADNHKYYVYPSTRKERRACIIIEKDGTQDLQIGVANGNASGTDINIGTSRMFKTQDSKTVALRVPGSEALVPLYASAISADINSGNLEAMQQNGCMTSFPEVDSGAIVAKVNPVVKPKLPDILPKIEQNPEPTDKDIYYESVDYKDSDALFGRPSPITQTLSQNGSCEKDICVYDIRQNTLNDCYLLAALAGLAHHRPDFIREMIKDNKDGTYTVRFYEEKDNQFKPVYFRVDAQLPRTKKMTSVASYSAYALYSIDFSQNSKLHDEAEIGFWVALIEKAFVKFIDGQSYSDIPKGLGYLVMPYLTGKKSRYYSSPKEGETGPEKRGVIAPEGDLLSIESLRNLLLTEGKIITLGSRKDSPFHQKLLEFLSLRGNTSGINVSHEYTLLGVNDRELILYNPLGPVPLKNDARTNEDRYGVVRINYDDFKRNFDLIHVSD